jgi:hypothetical protein
MTSGRSDSLISLGFGSLPLKYSSRASFNQANVSSAASK